MSKIIEGYTRESGVRWLEKEIGSVCRAKAVQYAEAKDSGHAGKISHENLRQNMDADFKFAENYKPKLSVQDVEDILGIEKFDEEIAEQTRYFFHYLIQLVFSAVCPLFVVLARMQDSSSKISLGI